ncbi:MAG: SpoIIE family protein phosphatase, partial [Myxococcales bacterium]|nr:SpoIIE family protein phosphatase [Myxococcales bacterium]
MDPETRSTSIDPADISGAFALLAEMTQDFNDALNVDTPLDIDTALERALAIIVAHVDAEAGSLWLVTDDAKELVCSASVGPTQIRGMRVRTDEGIIGRAVCENVAQQVLDVSLDPEFNAAIDVESGFETHSILCSPMSFSDRVLGAVEVVNKRGRDSRFGPDDIQPLKVLASSAALAISNAHLASAQAEHQRVRRELELAAEIQRSLLPPPRPAPFPVYGLNVPARTVSGDFYDFLPLDGERVAFCLGDVSGKGMNAAIMMAKTASLFRCLAKTTPHPGALLAKLNAEICETATRGMFVTMAAGVLLTREGVVVLANAGHEPPLLHHTSGAFENFRADAPPLGIVDDAEFPEIGIELRGGSLYIMSDGVTEAETSNDGTLGAEGMQRLIERFSGQPLIDRIESISAEVRKLELRDDITVLAVTDDDACRAAAVSNQPCETLFEARYSAESSALKTIRSDVRECLRTAGCDPTNAVDIVMAIDEACQNVIR